MAPTSAAIHTLAFHSHEAEVVAERRGSSLSSGLTHEEAGPRLEASGRNVLEDVHRPNRLRLLAEQFADALVILLFAAAFVSGVLLGDALDAAVILAIVVGNAALGFVQEYRAEQAMTLQLAVVYLPPVAALFHTVPLPIEDWLAIGALNALALAAIGLIRAVAGRRSPGS